MFYSSLQGYLAIAALPYTALPQTQKTILFYFSAVGVKPFIGR